MGRKRPIFGIAAVSFLTVLFIYLFLFFALDQPGAPVPSDVSPAVVLEGFAVIVFAVLVTVVGLSLAVISSGIGLIRKEKPALSLIALFVSVPLLAWLLFALLARA